MDCPECVQTIVMFLRPETLVGIERKPAARFAYGEGMQELIHAR